LQFHIEHSVDSNNLMLQNCADELVDGKYIRTADEIISQYNNVREINKLLNLLLDNIEREFGRSR
jgi:hypothetical protein